MLHYREAAREDGAAIGRLHAESWLATFGHLMTDEYRDSVFDDRASVWNERMSAPPPNQFVLLAEEDGRLAAFACAYGDHHPRWGTFLDNLHVGSEWQSRGLGRSLMIRVAEWCITNHPDDGLHLLVLEMNQRARAFYERLGAADVEGESWVPPGFTDAPSRRYAWTREGVRDIPRLAGDG